MPAIDSTPLHLVASKLYQLGVAARNAAFDSGLLRSKSGELPSICVGNVVVGGSGKTPFVQFLANGLQERGHRPAVLLRGYKGSQTTPYIVSAQDSAAKVGDEALLHRKSLPQEIPVCTSADRLQGISHIKKHSDANVVVLDDGLQHRWLEAERNILLLNSSNKEQCLRWSAGKLLPFGYLREPLASSLKRSDCVVHIVRQNPVNDPVTVSVNDKADNKAPEIPKLACEIPRLIYTIGPSEFIDLHDGSIHPLGSFANKEIDAATAIAVPQLFFDSLRQLGIKLCDKHSYADHHHFSAADIKELFAARQRPLCITEKDAVKLRPHVTEKSSVFVLKTKGTFADAESEEQFWKICLSMFKQD